MAKQILTVDDSNMITFLWKMVLEQEGYVVTQVKDGETALTLLNAGNHYDCVIADQHMEGMNGLELAAMELLGRADAIEELAANMAGRAEVVEFTWADPTRKIAPDQYRYPWLSPALLGDPYEAPASEDAGCRATPGFD